MAPAFLSWSEFFAMSGYSFFVWSAVVVTVLLLLALIFHTHWRRKQLFHEIVHQRKRVKRIQQARIIEKGKL